MLGKYFTRNKLLAVLITLLGSAAFCSYAGDVGQNETDIDQDLNAKYQAQIQFRQAVLDGDVSAVKSMLEDGLSVAAKDWDKYEHPVMLASSYVCNVDILELLKQAGSPIDYIHFYHTGGQNGIVYNAVRAMYTLADKTEDESGELRWVRIYRYFDTYPCLQWLLRDGANPNVLYETSQKAVFIVGTEETTLQDSAISIASRARDLKMLDLLYQYEADINEPRRGVNNPLSQAIVYKRYKVVRWLLDHEVDIYNDAHGIGVPMVRSGDIKVKTWFLEMGVNPEKYNYLYDAFLFGDMEFLEKIIAVEPLLDINRSYDFGVNKWKSSNLLIRLSRSPNRERMLKRFLELGADPCLVNSDGQTAYAQARKSTRTNNLAILEAHYPEASCIKKSVQKIEDKTTEPNLD